MRHFLLVAILFGPGGSIAFAQWHTQTIDTEADFRGLCVVSPNVAWVSGTKGTYARTTDGGKTWSVATVPDAEKLDFRDVEAFGESIAYLLSAGPGDASRIYKTVDGGKSWALQFKCGDPADFLDAIAFWDKMNGIAFGDPVKGLFQLIVTSDGGANWKPLAAKVRPPALPGEGAFAASGTCLVTHGESDVWFGTGGAKSARVFHSRDRGQNWDVSETPIIAGGESAGIFSIAFRDKQHGMIVGGDYRKPNDTGATAATTSDGGKTWTPLDKRLPFRSAVAWAKDRWVAVGTSGSHVSLDNGATWKLLDRENYNSVGFTSSGEGWAVGPKGRIAKAGSAIAAADDDIVIADFEGENYGAWKATGTAFGPGPAKGALPGQMPVTGFKGKSLVNSFFKGDGTTGTLTSPSLKIERDYITFLIGGGGHEGKTCMNLLLDGKVVRTATGPNTQPGGSEELQPHFWDVKDLRARTITIQIVDQATGGWGHINIDHIVQTNTKPRLPDLGARVREFTINKRYLILPIKNGAKSCEITLEVDGTPVRRYGTELATSRDSVDWYAYFTIESYKGKPAKVSVNRATEDGFNLIQQTDELPGARGFYTEALRPQFHFSQKVGWNNDPNGMVYLDGEWHLYFQHNPVGWKWGNMTWGHAVSKDLVHWEQLPDVLFPGTMARGACFSGGAVIDRKNTAGWKTGDNDVLVAFLTDTGAGEAVAYSNDRGRSFTWYQGNPVVKHKGRDPKVIWYAYDKNDRPLNDKAKELGGHWVMAVYDEHPKLNRTIAFYTSTNLKDWQVQSHLPGYYECPEIFKLPVNDKADDTRWIVFAADARYAVGKFDGKMFTPEHEGRHQVHHGAYYASQTFDNAPDGRRIQIGWVRLDMPGMPFNQTFSFPHRLTLRKTDDGIRMFAKPVPEIEKLHQKKHAAMPQDLPAGSPVTLDVAGQLFDIRATFELGDAQRVGLDIGGNIVAYDAVAKKLNGAALKPVSGRVTLQVLVDRPMIEICGNDGAVVITTGRERKGDVKVVQALAEGAAARLIGFEVYELQSIWSK